MTNGTLDEQEQTEIDFQVEQVIAKGDDPLDVYQNYKDALIKSFQDGSFLAQLQKFEKQLGGHGFPANLTIAGWNISAPTVINPADTNSGGGSGTHAALSTGAIIGIVFGAVAAVALGAMFLGYYFFWGKQSNIDNQSGDAAAAGAENGRGAGEVPEGRSHDEMGNMINVSL